MTGKRFPLCSCSTPKYFNADPDLTELNKFDPMMEEMAWRHEDMRQVIAVDEDLDLFSRAWCIAEIHMAHKLAITQAVTLLDLDMLVDTESFFSLRIENCKASRQEDVAEILSKIEDKPKFNREVKNLLCNEEHGIFANAYAHKAQELAGRSMELSSILHFYSLLGKEMMHHFHGDRSTTLDVVRQAIIPSSVSQIQGTANGKGFAYATFAKPWGNVPAAILVCHI